jgi:hypothetical protein
MPGDEDDWDMNVRRQEVSLKIETAPSWQSHIQHQAGGPVRASQLQEFGHCSYGSDGQPDGPQQILERAPDCGIVIYDQDSRVQIRHRRLIRSAQTEAQ